MIIMFQGTPPSPYVAIIHQILFNVFKMNYPVIPNSSPIYVPNYYFNIIIVDSYKPRFILYIQLEIKFNVKYQIIIYISLIF